MADLDGLKKALRALVVSSASTMDAMALLRDYRRMLGEPLPAARYGFRDPVQFLRERCGDCFLFHGSQTNPILTLIVPDSIKHIDQYVQSQKSSKLIRGKRRSVPESIIRKPPTSLIVDTFKRVPPRVEESKRYTNNTPRHTQTEAPRAHQTYTEPRNSEPPPLNTKPVTVPEPVIRSRPDSHVKDNPDSEVPFREELSNGHEDGAYSRQKMQQFYENRMQYRSQRLSDSRESLEDDDSGRQTSSSLSSRSAAALATLQSQLVRLVARRPQGVWCSELVRLYEEEYGCELNFGRFRYPSVSACACAVPALAARRAHSGDWLVTVRGEQEEARAPAALRLRRAPRDCALSRPVSHIVLDPDEALPGIDYDPDVFPADCLCFLESIPAGDVAGVRPGDMLGVVVGEVYSPSHLWVLRLGPDYDLMEQYMDEMTEYYNKGEGADRVLAAGARRPGQYCSSVFEGDWHRSLIVQLVDTDTVKVRHVDYGTVDTVPAGSLRPLRREWAQLPAQAVRARLAGLRPAAACRRWPRPAAAYCLQLVRERRLVANVVAADHEENILELFLIDTSTEDDVNITDRMIRAGHADPRALPALGTREWYLLPAFRALEAGVTLNYAEIHALLRDGIALEYVDAYREHVAPLLPSSGEAGEGSEAGEAAEPGDGAATPSPPPPLPLAANRVPMLSMLRLHASPEPASTVAEPEPEPASTVAEPEPEPASIVAEPLLEPASTVASSSPEPASTMASPTPTPSPEPAPAAPPAPAPPAPAPPAARCPPTPHPASFYALPFCPCAPAPCCPKPPAAPPLDYAAGYFRPRAAPQPAPAHFYAQYPRPAVSVGYYPDPHLGPPVFSSAGPNLQNFAPAPPQIFIPNAAPVPPHFVPNSAQNHRHGAFNSVQNPHNFGPNPASIPPCGPSPARVPQRIGPSPEPNSRVFSSSSSLNRSAANPSGPQAPESACGADSAVRLSAEDCEFFELLSRVDPGAAHRHMMAALRRAREAAGAGAPGAGAPGAGAGAPGARAPGAGLNPDATEFRCPPQGFRPPPGFENFIK